MAYFPFYMDITGKKGVIAGGGRTALHKIGRLLPFSPQLVVIAPEILPEIRQMEHSAEAGRQDRCAQGLTCLCRRIEEPDLQGAAFVIAATNDEGTNGWISRLCRAEGIPVNVVDNKEKCSFIFPALVKKGPLTIAISTEGASPHVAAQLSRKIEADLPGHTEEILDYLAKLRSTAKKQISNPSHRSAFLKEIAQLCLEKNHIPDDRTILARMEAYRRCSSPTDKL